MLVLSICLITSSFFLYSTSIWSERIIKRLRAWMLILFTIAFLSDIFGTTLMFKIAHFKFDLCLHSCLGVGALVFMGLHLIWAFVAIFCRGRYEHYFHRCSIWAWFIWLIAFLTGIALM